MEIFSEIYNCYYQIIKDILQKQTTFSQLQLYNQVTDTGYDESPIYLMPKLISGEWSLTKKHGDLYISKLHENFYVPLTSLQKAYIHTLLYDERIQLFFTPEQLQQLKDLFADFPILWKSQDFYYYDRFSHADDYSDPVYQKNFRTILSAISNKQYLDITYESKLNHRVHHHYLPYRLEYSIKNNKFRLIGILKRERFGMPIEILNLDRIKDLSLLPEYETNLSDIDKRIRASYYKEPVQIHIYTNRNALERAMLHFANYEKDTRKIDDNTYECLIYYNKKMETELLIEILSFGPMIKVLGNEFFLNQLKQRLINQKNRQRV